jgi:hypothetical protein
MDELRRVLQAALEAAPVFLREPAQARFNYSGMGGMISGQVKR